MVQQEPADTDEWLERIRNNIPEIMLIMGSRSDWRFGEKDGTCQCSLVLSEFGVSYQIYVVSAHRTPQRMYDLANTIDGKVKVVIAAAGGAAHLPGMMAALLRRTPVIGLPMKSGTLSGVDSLYSIVQMPPGVPVGTMAIGGAENAAIYAATIVGLTRPEVMNAVAKYRSKIHDSVPYLPVESGKPAKEK